MDEPNRDDPTDNYSDGDDPVVPPLQSHSAHHHQNPIASSQETTTATSEIKPTQKPKRRKWKAYWRKFCRLGPGDHIQVISTIAIAAFAMLQYFSTRANNASTTTQVSSLVAAENLIEQHQGQLVTDNKQGLADNRKALDLSLKENRVEVEKVLGQNRDALQVQTSAANGELSAVQRQTEIAERPWLTVMAKITGFSWGEPVRGMPTLDLKYQITVENFGNLPASKVYIVFDGNPPIETSEKLFVEEQDKFCEAEINRGDFITKTGTNAVTVFPRRPHSFKESSIRISDSNWKVGSDIVRYIRGCVVYVSPTHIQPRQAGFLFQLVRKNWAVNSVGPVLPKYKDPFEEVDLSDISGEVKSD